MKMKKFLATAVAVIVAICTMPNLSMVVQAGEPCANCGHSSHPGFNCLDCGCDTYVPYIPLGNCTKCEGTGKLNCDRCFGSGEIPCGSCISGSTPCNEIHIPGGSDDAICKQCGEAFNVKGGDVTCNECSGGYKTCPNCGGKLDCPTCGGTGSIKTHSSSSSSSSSSSTPAPAPVEPAPAPVVEEPVDTTPVIAYVPSVAGNTGVINNAQASNLTWFCIQGAPDSYLAPVVLGLMQNSEATAPVSVKCEMTTALPQEITAYLEANPNVTIYVKYIDGTYIPVNGAVLARLPKVAWYGPELLKAIFGTVDASQIK